MLILKGFIIGIAKIIPGVSGALLAMSLGIYEKAVESISNFFKSPMKSIKYLFPIGIGLGLSVILGSKALIYLLDNYYTYTLFLFIGLMLGGTPFVFKKLEYKKLKPIHYILLIISFAFVFLLSLVGKQGIFMKESIYLYMFIGFIDAFTMVVPGISGTAIMMLLGVYHLLLGLFSDLSNITYLIFYAIGLGISVLIISKVMDYLFKKKEQIIYSIIIGFMTSSILILFIDTIKQLNGILNIILCLFLLVIGYFAGNKLN